MSKKVLIGKGKDLSDKLIDKTIVPPKKVVASTVASPKKAAANVIVPPKKPVINTVLSPKKVVLNNPVVPKKVQKIIDAPASKTQLVKTKIQKKDKLEIPPEHETYFVYLKNPLEYRRHLLESSRKILFCLKSHQKIILIRQKKFEEMRKLRASVKELIYLNKKFNDKLPKYQTEFLGGSKKETKDKPLLQIYPKATKPNVAPQEKTEMEKLEESLANIEKKLKMLQ